MKFRDKRIPLPPETKHPKHSSNPLSLTSNP